MTFTDDFTRPDGGLGSPWSTLAGAFGIVSNTARHTGPLSYPGAPSWPGPPYVVPSVAVVDVGSADMVVEWERSAGSGGLWCPFRVAADDSMLIVGASSTALDQVYLMRIEPSGATVIASATDAGWWTEPVRVRAVGSSITVHVGGVPRITATSTYNIGETHAGIGGNAIGWWPASFADSFTRADSSSLGSPWTAHAGSWGIDANRAKWVVGSGAGRGAATVDLGSPCQTCEWEWSALAKGPSYQIFRYLDIDNFWIASGTGAPALTGRVYLHSIIGGTVTEEVYVDGVTWGPGSTLKVEATDTAIKVWSAGVLIIDFATSVSFPGSRAGIGGNMSDPAMPTTRWTRFDGVGTPSNSQTHPVAVGPWLDAARWTRFHCAAVAPSGWHIGSLRFGSTAIAGTTFTGWT